MAAHSSSLDRHTALGILWVLASTFCFAFQGIVVKIIYAEEIELAAMMFLRLLIFVPLLWLWRVWHKENRKPVARKTILAALATGAMGFYLMPYINFTALQTLEAGIERVLLFTYTLFVILLNSLLYRKAPPRAQIIAFFFIQLGIFLLIGGFSGEAILKANLQDTGLVLTAAFIFGVYVIITQRLVRVLGTVRYISIALLGALAASVIPAFLLPQEAFDLSPKGWGLVALIAVISFPPGMMFAEGVRRIGGARASLISTVGPVLTFIFAYVLLEETVTLLQLCGAAIVLASLIALENRAVRSLLSRRYRLLPEV